MSWKLDKPVALQIGEWEDWEKETRSKYPIRFFIQETLPDFFRDVWNFFYRPARRAYWWIMYRVHPKHHYHIIKPRTLTPGYYDQDTLMVHSVMECLVSYFENESDRVGWDWDEPHSHAYKEMVEIYHWWTKLYPKRDEMFVNGEPLPELPELPKEWGFMAPINEKYEDEPIVKKWKAISKIHVENEEAWHDKTEDMLIRAIKIRSFLWS